MKWTEGVLLGLVVMATAVPGLMAAPAFQVLYAPPPSSSGVLFNGITQARDGNFYGTAPAPSAGGGNRLFRLTPAGGFSTLVSFTGPNGDDPEGGLLLATDGRVYGTTLGWLGEVGFRCHRDREQRVLHR